MPTRNEHPADDHKRNDIQHDKINQDETHQTEGDKTQHQRQPELDNQSHIDGNRLDPPPGDPPEHRPANDCKPEPAEEYDVWPDEGDSSPVDVILKRLKNRVTKLQNEVDEVDEAVYALQSKIDRDSDGPSVPSTSGGGGGSKAGNVAPDSKTIARLRSVKYVADGQSKGFWEAIFLYDDNVCVAELTDRQMELLLNLVDWFATKRKLPKLQTGKELADAVTNGKWSNLTTLIQRLRNALEDADLPRSLIEMTPRNGVVDVRYRIRVIGGLPVLDDATANTTEMRSWLSRLTRRKQSAS